MSHILIVEDEALIRSSLKRLLERHDYTVSEAGSVADACERYSLDEFDLIISDVRLPGEPGTSLIEKAKPTPVLIMTSFGSMKSAVEAMKQGAVDYISKPFDHDEMLLTIERILREKALITQNEALKQEVARTYPTGGMIGSCAAMQDVFNRIRKVAPLATTVLIRGESGTGKELVARALHDQSPRASGSMISVNCAAIPETLIESELFGHEKGAFTGAQTQRKGLVEAADGGTLFLDEIGELPMEAQARLLRLIQEKEVRRIGATQTRRVDVRLVAATHRDLKKLASEGRFREDLYYRLNVVELLLPPLRERGEDILELADKLLLRTCQRLGIDTLSFSAEAREAIRHYAWPGNVRELENAIERAAILSETPEIEPEHLAIDIARREPSHTRTSGPDPSANEPAAGLSLEDYFQHFVLEYQDHMSETELAQKLGISRKSLWERRQRLGIPRRKSPGEQDTGPDDEKE
ncbi:MAG: sigma-54-dependent Fis family transcriptional regulator [Moraxellaceae bacterium]|nr:sigma-54-dependent Fis family transcriptional regulator [Moraxellaceae bacterium]MBP9044904.1 sigma-54-dependent Fis family transcriptional regulator [Moraxellaceae bacterium]MBP9730245.1 sigma-54-dependent Fis family transcriptional regulator [Moraxellaceae bacterium]